MGLLDNLEGQAVSGLLGGNSSPLASSLLQMIQNQPGGLQGLVQNFHDKGLGGVVSSWVSTGQNLPISGDQIHQVLGSDQVTALDREGWDFARPGRFRHRTATAHAGGQIDAERAGSGS